MLVISSLIVGLWTTLMLAACVRLNNYEVGDSISLFHLNRHELIAPAILGAAVGLSNFMAPKGGATAASCLVAMLIVFVYLAYSNRHCKTWKEIAMCIFAIIPIHVTFMSVVAAVAETTPVLMNFAWIPFIIVISVALTSLIVSKRQSVDNEKVKKIYGILRFVVPVIAVLIILGILVKAFGPNKEAEVEAVPETEEVHVAETAIATADWYHFYNTEMLKNDDAKDDYNFGPNPLEKLATDKVASGELSLKDIANKTEDELIGLASVEDVENDFRGRIAKDPALGAGDMAYFDSLTKTRYLGTFYDECKGEWASTINLAKERWMKDKGAYENTLAAWFAFLDTADKVELVKVTGGLDDQMYMNPYTVDLVPDVIVMETTDHDDYFIRYTFNIKGEEIKVAYRVNCGYQPTNVSKVMNIKAQKNPNKKEEPKPKKQETPSGGKSVTTPKNTTPVSAPVLPPMFTPDVNPNITPGPTPGPDPDITNPKDPTKGTDVGKNDTPGPGPNTNNGVGARYSTEDDSTKSSHMTEVKAEKAEAELKEVSTEQKVGGDSNESSTKVEKDVTVDANADKGTGNGGIDKATSTHDTHAESSTGGSDSTSDDPAGTELEGPPQD